MDKLKEDELVKKIRIGDSQAENELVTHYLPKIRMITAQRILNADDRQEVVNDILIGLLVKLREGGFDPERGSSLSSYINGIVFNSITQYLKNYYTNSSRQEKINEHISEKFDDYNEFNKSYEEEEEIENRRKLWRDLINGLKPKYKEALYLRFYENLTVIEVAKKMNVTPQKVSDYIKYSKKLLLEEAGKKKNRKYLPFFFQIFLFFSNI